MCEYLVKLEVLADEGWGCVLRYVLMTEGMCDQWLN